ncbi:hypothetical protein CUU66_04705 [Peribacillus deserti]|uniref:Uncharacterized protein n=1 Tax=Peribacillus deserti TaxID=673318 RepID=A0A2N5M9S3_9BACI|nr:hypothetical protein CUU66_04705 [Peribacillus deserti]
MLLDAYAGLWSLFAGFLKHLQDFCVFCRIIEIYAGLFTYLQDSYCAHGASSLIHTPIQEKPGNMPSLFADSGK